MHRWPVTFEKPGFGPRPFAPPTPINSDSRKPGLQSATNSPRYDRMLILLSPSKTLDFSKQSLTRRRSTPPLLHDTEELLRTLRTLSPAQLAKLMNVGDELAEATCRQFAEWSPRPKPGGAKQAVLAYRGNAYVGLDAESFSADDFDFAHATLRILSGLYGVLRPLDRIQPYRLEMAARLKTPRGKNLYEFWGTRLTECLNNELKRQPEPVVMNLASNEYFKALQPKQLAGRIVTAHFKEAKNGGFKAVSAFAKKARGLMAAHIIKNRLTTPDDARAFNTEGYRFHPELSSENDWVFTRDTA